MNRLVIIGAGGHGKVIADIAEKNGYTNICFLDDHASGICMNFPIIGTCDDIERENDGDTDFVIGIGNNIVRKEVAEKHNADWTTLIHPSAQIAADVTIGKGTVVMAGAVVNVCTSIGNHCIINTGAVIEHDNSIDDYVHLSPRVALGGAVHIGRCTHVGIGASVKNNVDICDSCIVGAGAVVIHNITESGTYAGTPVRRLK